MAYFKIFQKKWPQTATLEPLEVPVEPRSAVLEHVAAPVEPVLAPVPKAPEALSFSRGLAFSPSYHILIMPTIATYMAIRYSGELHGSNVCSLHSHTAA